MYTKLMNLITLLWAGMILGISFLESWVKFRTPSLIKKVGLDVGKTVFSFFHKIQNILLILIIGLGFAAHVSSAKWVMVSGLIIIVCAQFFWLLPELNQRVDTIIEGKSLSPSRVHLFYGISEVFKLVLLIVLGF